VIEEKIYIRVGEFEIGVIFNWEREAFVKFLRPGRHWLLPPFVHYLYATIVTSYQSVSGQTKGARTAEGLPIILDWWFAYQLDPLNLPDYMKPAMARALPKFSGGMATNHGINCLQLVVEKCTIKDFTEPGIQGRIEQEFKAELAARLKDFGFNIGRVMVHSIQLPQQVLDALEDAHEREVNTQSEAEALERLYEVVSKFDDSHMARLAELERMRLLGKNGVTLVYPMGTVLEGGQQHGGATTGPTPRPIVRPQRDPDHK
jgi:regulator of protease activity HflC (stomatin/prohibitin superfamily)